MPVSGSQFDLAAGAYRATIASVGATLRSLTHDGRDLVVPFDADALRPFYRGAILAPWPNRVINGAYRFNGVDRQLPLTEPARAHALHGLAAWLEWTPVDEGDSASDAAPDAAADAPTDRITLRTVIEPQAGYPHRIQLTVTYSLDAGGLHTGIEALNLGADDAPYGTGPHPYLVAGAGRVDDWVLDLPASQVLTFTGERLIPDALVEVDADVAADVVADAPSDMSADASTRGPFDFRGGRRIESTFLDHAFTGLAADDAGATAVRVLTEDGSGVSISWGAELPWVQVHTADQADQALNRIGLAVEPMTCPPDAFNSGTDLVVLAPGSTHRADWTIAAV